MTRPPPLLIHGLCVFAMWLVADAAATASGGQRLLSEVLLGAGVAIALAGVVEFRRQRTTLDPRDPGKVSALVTGGVFRFSRNPMYTGFAASLVAWALYLDSLAASAFVGLFWLWLDRVQIPAEEARIGQLFGEPYRVYCRRVRRWL